MAPPLAGQNQMENPPFPDPFLGFSPRGFPILIYWRVYILHRTYLVLISTFIPKKYQAHTNGSTGGQFMCKNGFHVFHKRNDY